MSDIVPIEKGLTVRTVADVTAALAFARKLRIETQADRDEAMRVVSEIRAWVRVERVAFDEKAELANKAHKAATKARNDFLKDPLEADALLLQKAQAWTEAENQARETERRRLQAEADEKARKEQERLEAAALKLKTPELREARLEESRSIQAPVIGMPEVQKAQGESRPAVWKARVTNKEAFIRWAFDTGNMYLIMPDESELGQLAKRTKGTMKADGVEFYDDGKIRVRTI